MYFWTVKVIIMLRVLAKLQNFVCVLIILDVFYLDFNAILW